MFKNNIKIAWRHLLKDKFISLINFTGLVVGMTAAIFIWQYVSFEKSYDQFHENADQIVRVRTDRVRDGVAFMQFAAGAACAGPVIHKNFPEVEDYVKLVGSSNAIYSTKKEVTFNPEKVYYAMPSFFDIFSFSLVKGDPKTCLNEPFTACITEATAKKMFGDTDPIGQTIIRNNDREYKVTGILKEAPLNSHLKFDILLSYITYSDVLYADGDGSSETDLYSDGYLTYLKLSSQTDWKVLEAKLPEALTKAFDEDANNDVVFYLQPFKDIHLTSNFLFEPDTPGDGNAVNFLWLIGSLVLLIAWFNYVNLSTARSELRAKEVGVRKVVGSGRVSLIRQFMTEAGLMNFLAIVSALAATQVLSPWFIQLIDKPIPTNIFSNISLLATILGVFLVGTILTGLYPAFLLSSFKPITALTQGKRKDRKYGGNWLRKGLVLCQFIASVGLIASTIIVYNQLNFMQQKELGVNIDQTLVIKSPIVADSTTFEKGRTLIKELGQLAAVKEVTSSTSVPGRPFGWTAGISKLGENEQLGVGFHALAADDNYAETYGLELVAGRYLEKEMGADNLSCILNEKGVEVFKIESPEAAIGADINFWGDRMKVVGVVKDFHQESPKSVVEPMIMRTFANRFTPDYYSLKLSTQEIAGTINNIERTWTTIFPGSPLDYFFLDDYYQEQYSSDRLFGQAFSLFAGLAIFVSCLGLFALIAFVAERRKKEIGIRKVLGASIPSIVQLLSKEFLGIVVIALLIAAPIAYYAMNNWLDNFAYRIDIQWSVFVIAGLAAILIAFLTVGFQSVRAALANPIETLKTE